MPEYLKASDQMTRRRDNIRMTDSDHRIIKNNSFILFYTRKTNEGMFYDLIMDRIVSAMKFLFRLNCRELIERMVTL